MESLNSFSGRWWLQLQGPHDDNIACQTTPYRMHLESPPHAEPGCRYVCNSPLECLPTRASCKGHYGPPVKLLTIILFVQDDQSGWIIQSFVPWLLPTLRGTSLVPHTYIFSFSNSVNINTHTRPTFLFDLVVQCKKIAYPVDLSSH